MRVDFVTNLFINVVKALRHPSLQGRFLLRVLLPPFFILLIAGIATYVILSSTVREAEVANLKRVAVATSAKLGQEFEIRETILKNTGERLFEIKSENRAERSELNKDYKACETFIETNSDFTQAPGKACEPFYGEIAIALQKSTSLQAAIVTAYQTKTSELVTQEQEFVNDKMKEFVTFFPETSQLLIINDEKEIISKSETGGIKTNAYNAKVQQAIVRAIDEDESVEALTVQDRDTKDVMFAYPIENGAVLATYNLNHEGFIYPSWKSTPIDNSKVFIVIADTDSDTSYPEVEAGLYRPALKADSKGSFNNSDVNYLAATDPVGKTGWEVVAASPSAIALGSLANAQIVAVLVGGVMLVSFLWVGSAFIRRTVGSIVGLVGGAVIFSSGSLSHRIDAERMSDKEFSQLAETMNHMAGKIQEAEKAIDRKNKEFINVATHEIKAPITAIIGSLSMMLDDGMGVIDDMARNLSTQAYKGTIRLRNLVNELLDIARLESGSTKFELVKIDAVSEIKEMIEVQRTPAVEQGIDIQFQPPKEPITIIADKTKFEIILTNFISNGIKYNRPQGKVVVSCQIIGDKAQINIQDTGLGIPAEQQAKMFQKFFRVEGSDRANIPGTGLGMFITKQFIEGMGGKLWFESEAGKGTVFHFTLPLATNKSASTVTKTIPMN